VQYDVNSEISISKMSGSEYQALSYKAMTGNPTQYYYQPRIAEGRLFLYPQSENESQYINLVIEKPFDDLDASSDTCRHQMNIMILLFIRLHKDLLCKMVFMARQQHWGRRLKDCFHCKDYMILKILLSIWVLAMGYLING
jgi:hypothetical protein